MSISRSSERGTFALKHSFSNFADLLEEIRLQAVTREEQESWKLNNLEYDLRSTDWILQKARSSEAYSQNLYAALCNNEFRKTDLENTPENIDRVLADGFPKWSCSWRHAGGIIADMREEGDYIDWYCSGIIEDITEQQIAEFDTGQRARYEIVKNFVNEGFVTDEVREDLLKLGWVITEDNP